MVKINYVIAAFAGDRRVCDESYDKDRSHYLKIHLAQLSKLKHNLDQITIVVAKIEGQPKFDEYINGIKDQYVVIERENRNQSYGSWAKAYEIFRDKFDYYIFIEDDYLFVQDNFDTTLVDLFQSKPNCGYLCSLYTEDMAWIGGHATISNGICSAIALEKVWSLYDCLPTNRIELTLGRTAQKIIESNRRGYNPKRISSYLNAHKIPPPPGELEWNYVNLHQILKEANNIVIKDDGRKTLEDREKIYSVWPQISFSQGFLAAGYELHDFSEEYHIPFQFLNKMGHFGNAEKEYLVAPVQYAYSKLVGGIKFD
tara:strand:- start:24932 stop:25870 length:939 start_codon:yes stop_codon:yes gene_type:complete